MGQPKSVTLYCTAGSSDKIYQAALQHRDSGWVVEFAFGPRGKALKTGTKTAEPVDFAAAEKIFDKLVREKMAKGYTPHDSGVAYTNTEHEQDASGLAPQLPTAITEDAVERYLADPQYGMQEKRDGENRLLTVTGAGQVRGVNRRGLYVDIPLAWAGDLEEFKGTLFAGEHTAGDQFDAFDLLEHEAEDLRSLPYQVRYERLVALATRSKASAWFKVLPLQRTMEAKRAELAKLRNIHAEGVVFKKLAEPFEAGRSTAALKFKFVDSATCIVLKHNLQRSIVVGLLGAQGDAISLGNVTVPANEPVPPLDALVEVRYLYRYEDGCFEQPVYLRQRADLTRQDATLTQIVRIKRKAPQGGHAFSE